jgi:hypothetical protein
MIGRVCDPLLWRNFSYEKTSKTSKYGDDLIYKFVSLSVPAQRTNRDVAELVAEQAHIPVESLSDDLNQPVFTRGQVCFGFAGDEFDKITRNYDSMQWWLSDNGLNIATIMNPTLSSTRRPTLHELMLDMVQPGDATGLAGAQSDRRDSLALRLKEGQNIADPGLKKMFEAVAHYNWYFKELRLLKVAVKKYQTPAMLKAQFPNFELWSIVDEDDEKDIVEDKFYPGHFSWTLVKRLNGLKGNDDRTLQNYRKKLKAAGIRL